MFVAIGTGKKLYTVVQDYSDAKGVINLSYSAFIYVASKYNAFYDSVDYGIYFKKENDALDCCEELNQTKVYGSSFFVLKILNNETITNELRLYDTKRKECIVMNSLRIKRFLPFIEEPEILQALKKDKQQMIETLNAWLLIKDMGVVKCEN